MAFINPLRKMVTILALLDSLTNSVSAQPFMSEPKLAQLLQGIENCDLQIIHNSPNSPNFQHFQFLPTTIFNLAGYSRYTNYFDVSQVRLLQLRIVLAIYNSEAGNTFETTHPVFSVYGRIISHYLHFRTATYEGHDEFAVYHSSSEKGIVPIVFSNEVGLIHSTILRMTYLLVFEILGILQTKDDKITLCFGRKAFKILSKQETLGTCSSVQDDRNILRIYATQREPPTAWTFQGSLDAELGSDLMKISQTPGQIFNRLLTNFSIELALLQDIFFGSNASVIYSSLRYFVENSPRSIVLIEHSLSKAGHSWIQTETGGFSFVTCYAENFITFDFYVTPFQPEIWVALATSYITVTLALSVWYHKKYKGSYAPWLAVLGALVEEGIPVRRIVERNHFFRAIFGCWIIICVTLTNAYNGIMITELNAPLHAISVLTFRDLICDWQEVKWPLREYTRRDEASKKLLLTLYELDLYVKSVFRTYVFDPSDPTDRKEEPAAPPSKDCFSLLAFPSKEYSLMSNFFVTMFFIYRDYKEGFGIHSRRKHELAINLLKQHHLPRNATKLGNVEQVRAIEREVVDCQKSVIVAEPGPLGGEMEYYGRQYPWLKWYRSKDTLLSGATGIRIEDPGSSRVPRNAAGLVEGGIYGSLMKEKHARRNLRRRRIGAFKPPKRKRMAMDGSFSTVFILCGSLAAGGILIFCLEWYKRIKERFFKNCRVPRS